ncbi:methyltransferase domain-containing protein [Halobacillus litoralis]|uniref:Methyltransferase domain-containing protein n=1 Tax=Halobacillus litoralis TaxID=45668 RepID=A0A845E6Q3_9BACI|nr:class I SAM-dependent methyltransferase [Halobacillus litoralis]MYL49846.1 methyltransferase domain-containing protein [Halobacillus litoralis]
MKEMIRNYEDVLDMLDSLLREPAEFWNGFYNDREKGVPFFENIPDENLVGYFKNGWLRPRRVLELGCGPGRNAIYLAKQGCQVDAVDLSEESLKWAHERARAEEVDIHFMNENLFELNVEPSTYDLVYDSGCFHHIAPHRRMDYIKLLKKALIPGGFYGLTCFKEKGEYGGADISDWEVYRSRSLLGGLGYSERKLREIFSGFSSREIREMEDRRQTSNVFGVPGLLTALFQKEI